MPWKWLNFFLDDDAELKSIGEEYAAGRLLTGQVKKRLIEARSSPFSPISSYGFITARGTLQEPPESHNGAKIEIHPLTRGSHTMIL